MISVEEITDIANRLLKMEPDPIPRYRILKDLLDRPANDQDLLRSRRVALESRWIKDLSEEQCEDGGWKRFHSADSGAKRRIPTTEAAIRRVVQLGVDVDTKMTTQAIVYLERLMTHELAWPESKEINDKWPVGQELFIAATLAELSPDHKLLIEPCRKWAEIATSAFESGQYDPEAEWKAHCRLTGAVTMRNSYLVLRNRYALSLLSSPQADLCAFTEQALLNWLWKHPRGLGYADVPLSAPINSLRHTQGYRWLDSHMLLTRFSGWSSKAEFIVRDLIPLQNQVGLWDFGPSLELPRLSENYRREMNRTIDHSVHALLLLDAFRT